MLFFVCRCFCQNKVSFLPHKRSILMGLFLVFWAMEIQSAFASEGPEIPEPMVFDLVRGLDAKKGEIEINALGMLNLRDQSEGLHWAPEIEYAFRDGLAIEFEIPIVGTTVKSLKFAMQGTFGMAANGNFIHGLQGITEYFLKEEELQIAALYLFGYRFNSNFSMFVMAGVEGGYRFSEQRASVKGLLNPSFFFEITRHMLFGLETNLAYSNTEGFSALIMPQFHFRFGKIVALQFGIGAIYEKEAFAPHLAFRLVVQERLVETDISEKNGKKPPAADGLALPATRPTR